MKLSCLPLSLSAPHIAKQIMFLICLFLSVSCGDGEKKEASHRAKIAEAKKALEEENYEKAKHSLEDFLDQFPKNVEALFVYADVLIKTDQLLKAQEKANEILEIDPALAEPHAILGEVAYRRGNFPKALNLSRKALKINSKLQAPYQVIGEIYIRQGKIKEGIKVLLEAYNLAPDDIETLRKLSAGYIKDKDYVSAKKYLDLGLKMDEKVPSLHYNLALVYANSDNGPKALEQIEKALDLYEELQTFFWVGKSRDTRRVIERKFKIKN